VWAVKRAQSATIEVVDRGTNGDGCQQSNLAEHTDEDIHVVCLHQPAGDP
jgi:hypothetical protein